MQPFPGESFRFVQPHRARFFRLAASALFLGSAAAPLAMWSGAGASNTFVVSAVKNAKLGTILVSSRTLYALKPGKTACAAACLKIWPQAVLPKGVTKPTAGKGVSASKLGTVKRSGGALQVTYNGQALYWFSGDKSSTQVNGDLTDAWGKWSAVVIAKSSGSGSGSSSGGAANSGTGGVAF